MRERERSSLTRSDLPWRTGEKKKVIDSPSTHTHTRTCFHSCRRFSLSRFLSLARRNFTHMLALALLFVHYFFSYTLRALTSYMCKRTLICNYIHINATRRGGRVCVCVGVSDEQRFPWERRHSRFSRTKEHVMRAASRHTCRDRLNGIGTLHR